MAVDDLPSDEMALLDRLPHIVWVTDAAGRPEYCNEPGRRYTGCGLKDLLARPWSDFIHPDDRAVAAQRRAAGLASAAPYEVEYRLRRHDGEYRWQIARAAPVRDADGAIRRWVGTCSDVHERRMVSADRARQSRDLEASERLRSVAERAASLGSWEYDLPDGPARWSPGLRDLLGIPDDEQATPAWFSRRLHAEDVPRYHADMEQLAREHGTLATQYRLHGADGSPVRVVEVRAANEPGPDGRIRKIYGTAQDVTHGAEQAQRLAQMDRLMTQAERLAEMGSWEFEYPDGKRILSPGMHRLVGHSSADPATLEQIRSYMHDEDRQSLETAIAAAVETRTIQDTRARLRLPDGTHRQVELRVSCDPEPAQRPRVVVTVLDITERERLRIERMSLLGDLVSAADDERQRIAGHLHDDAVQAVIATLLRVDHAIATDSTEPLGRARATLESAIRSLRLTILELAPGELTGEGLASAVETYAEQFLESDGIAVTFQIDLDEVGELQQDVLLTTYRVVREAFSNIRRHAEAEAVSIVLRGRDGFLHGEIRDDGVGVPAILPDRPGHLGTALMRRRVSLAGGHIEIVARDDGPGTAVRWRLPLVRPGTSDRGQ